MSAAEEMLHRMFSNAVAEYHPFADYLGFEECSDGFLAYYQGTGDLQCLAIDSDGDIVGDTTKQFKIQNSKFKIGTASYSKGFSSWAVAM